MTVKGVDEMLEMTVDSNADGDTTDASDERYYYAFDTQGSVIGLIDDNGDLVEGYSYNLHGELTIRVPGSGNADVLWDGNDTVLASPARSPAGNPFFYTGQRLDPETDTYHYRARQYDPEQGRFLSRDPIGIWTDDINLGNPYAYVGNRPWQFRDPSGQFTWITAGIGAVVGAAAGAATYVGGAIINDADTSFAGLGKAIGIGAAGGALIGSGAGIAQGAGLFGTIAGGAVAGAGEGILAGVTVDALDNGAIDEGVGAYAAAAGTGALTGGALSGAGAGLRALRQADGGAGLRSFIGDETATLLPGAKSTSREVTDFIANVEVKSFGKTVGKGTIDLRPTIDAIESGSLKAKNVYRNIEGLLPANPSPNYYKEFVHPTPGFNGVGPERIVRGNGGELFYTPDHYKSFIPIGGRQ